MSDEARSLAERAASPSTHDASEGEVARVRAVQKLRAASEYPGRPTLAERIASLRAAVRARATKPVVFVTVLLALTIVGARVGARPRIAASAAHPVASASLVTVAAPSEAAPPIASASAAAPSSEAPAPSPGTLPDGRVVLNLATEDDLTKLPHIGPTRAKAILALRQKLGKFHMVTELLRVKGLGRKTLAKLAPKLLVDPPADASARSGAPIPS